MPFSRPIRSVTNCPSTTSDGRCGSDWTSAGRVRWPTAQTKLAAFPTQHRRGGALMLGKPYPVSYQFTQPRFIERGRYETPIIPRQNRQCLHCYFTTGVKTLEDEIHALATCPLFYVVRGRFGFPLTKTNLLIRYPTNLSPLHRLLPLLKLYMPYYLSTKSMWNTTGWPKRFELIARPLIT